MARVVAVGALLVCLLGACVATPAPKQTDLTVFAAASLRSALEPAQHRYEASHPGIELTISTDSSAALEAKIEQGAPADVFLSADTADPQRLVDADVTAGGVVPFARNRLTVIVPTGNPAGIRSAADLGRTGVRVIAAAGAVPITRYANEVVANLGRQPGYPADFAARYAANVASREDNVGAVVAKVGLGEGDAGIVYVTDAKTSTQVTTIPLPDAANATATYGGVVITTSGHRAEATAFLSWLVGPEGRSLLASFGFLAPS
ncbi:MAG TPA: molybdate ABC transporter substrate-binding protein [Candidatus Limnocylindrales bacterium]